MITCIMHYSDACGEHFCEEQQLDANVESPLNEMTRNFLEKSKFANLGQVGEDGDCLFHGSAGAHGRPHLGESPEKPGRSLVVGSG